MKQFSGCVHFFLDVVGLLPGVGVAADILNAGIYLAQGDKVGAAISAAAAIPIVGGAVAIGAKAGKAFGKKVLKSAAKKIAKTKPGKIIKKYVKKQAKKLKSVSKKIANKARNASRNLKTVSKNIKKNLKKIIKNKKLKKYKGKSKKELIKERRRLNNLIKNYLRDIEKFTGRKLVKKQKDALKNALRNKKYTKLNKKDAAAHRKAFKKVKDKLISEWEKNTGQKWPRYEEDVISENTGKIIRHAGDKYDAHHIIESSYDGDNKWWNIHPAKFPDEHQKGIHGSSSAANKLFK